MSGDSENKTPPKPIQIPAFDPRNSGEFAARVLAKVGVDGVLIGRLAIWAWVPDSGKHRFTKDVDLAVLPAELADLRATVRAEKLATRELPIGGFAVRLPNPIDPADEAGEIRVDFIDRTNLEWGDFGDVVAAAILDARQTGQRARLGRAELLVVSPSWLVILKLLSGRGKDDEDIKDLLRMVDVDVPFIRTQFQRFTNLAGLRTRFEEALVAMGHRAARRDDGES